MAAAFLAVLNVSLPDLGVPSVPGIPGLNITDGDGPVQGEDKVQYWKEFFYCMALLGPYILFYGWSEKFWVRLLAGFIAVSQGVSQTLLIHVKPGVSDPYLPFGDGSNPVIACCMASGVTGAYFAAYNSSLGIFILQVWGVYVTYVFLLVRYEDYQPSAHTRDRSDIVNTLGDGPMELCAGVFIMMLAVLMLLRSQSHCFANIIKVPVAVLAAMAGAAVGAHSIVEVVYYLWGAPPQACAAHPQCDGQYGMCCPHMDGHLDPCCSTQPAYGMYVTNRQLWCQDRASCRVYFGSFVVLGLVGLMGQYMLFLTERELPENTFAPASAAPRTGQDDMVKADPYWDYNLQTPMSTWVFLFFVLVLSSLANFIFALQVNWTGHTHFMMGVVFVLLNAFTLWSIIEFFCLTMYFHAVNFFNHLKPLDRCNFSRGIPPEGRTLLCYCLLSRNEQSSIETFDTALKSHLGNLDAHGRISTAVVSVSSKISVVQCEMRCRDERRETIRRTLKPELDVVIALHTSGRLSGASSLSDLAGALDEESAGTRVRARFWLGLYGRVLPQLEPKEQEDTCCSVGGPELREQMWKLVEQDCVQQFIYLHRTCKILKKPGQYQDLMVLSSTGRNTAYTYSVDHYAELGRRRGALCFGFKGNMEDDRLKTASDIAFEELLADLQSRGQSDIDYVAACGKEPSQRFHYTLVLDSDTFCPPRTVKRLIEVAEHPSNAKHGIINANLAHDFESSEGCTWHMWRSALIEVSKTNLLRAQYAIYGRVGFYGKGLIRNDMYINRVIGTPTTLVEALPVDILSHDTVEAKLMQPGIAYEVTLYEDVARNPISAFAQSTRWLLGEVRNGCYHDGPYKAAVGLSARAYTRMRKCEVRKFPWVRWREVPCSVGAEYLSHLGFRGFHAGPAIFLVILVQGFGADYHRLCPHESSCSGMIFHYGTVAGIEFLDYQRSIFIFVFTVLALFIIPNAMLLLVGVSETWCKCGRDSRSADEETSNASDIELSRISFSASFQRTGTVVNSRLSAKEMWNQRVSVLELPDEDPEPDRRVTMSNFARKGILILLEIILSILLYSPELIEGCLRLLCAVWAQISGFSSWTPQDQVEREVEASLSVFYALRKTWQVAGAGLLLLWFHAYVLEFKSFDFFTGLLCFTWTMHPFTTYVACRRVPECCKTKWIWTWVMELRGKKNREHSF
mmetsp:Transcript_52932/g.123928  ORF Transcript_52932/g.123928 Transcript_52932/m.123928 type:complete len:1188 (-) Transcript_52932:60-3623(-)